MSDQGTPEWMEGRRGRLTGSRIRLLLDGSQKGAQRLLATLRRERDAGPGGWMEGQDARGEDIDRGRLLEDRAIATYELMTGFEVERVGAIKHPELDGLAASPDGIIRASGAVVEVKAPRVAGHMGAWTYGIPRAHVPQVQCEIFCARHLGIERCVFLSYSEDVEPSRQLYIECVEADPDYQAKIAHAVAWFLPLLETDDPIPPPTIGNDVPTFF
jgi:hypothetical protein